MTGTSALRGDGGQTDRVQYQQHRHNSSSPTLEDQSLTLIQNGGRPNPGPRSWADLLTHHGTLINTALAPIILHHPIGQPNTFPWNACQSLAENETHPHTHTKKTTSHNEYAANGPHRGRSVWTSGTSQSRVRTQSHSHEQTKYKKNYGRPFK